MVNHKNGNYEWMSWTRKEWLKYLATQGIKGKIPPVQGTILERAKKAAEYLQQAGFHTFSGIELAWLSNQDTWTEEKARNHLAMLYGALAHHYRKENSAALQADIPAIQVLRIEVGAYQGNLHRWLGFVDMDKGALLPLPRDYYTPPKGLRISPGDWQEGITLPFPEEITPAHAKLFGYYWGAGNISAHNKTGLNVVLSVRREKKEILEHKVKPLVESIHNTRVELKKGKDEVGGQTWEENLLVKSSLALATYLHSVHGLPIESAIKTRNGRKRKNRLPKLPWEDREIVEAFLQGIVELRKGEHEDRYVKFYGEGAYGRQLVRYASKHGFGLHGPYEREGKIPGKWQIYCDVKTSDWLRERSE
jgi:hypothetical protein